ncbi:hypothetical protein PILCRDRAFT_721896 [Piloderma croceum F 1598]|uniref:Uncharacterized protein n=1 Tax=Piloderma croceum (strain F 1598) TaxID=765440 RepID=A0A0C3F0R3_PILCF|nr:hypothetical protein PILCRDRAFT_721896 [Piloderma croceum F 1598]
MPILDVGILNSGRRRLTACPVGRRIRPAVFVGCCRYTEQIRAIPKRICGHRICVINLIWIVFCSFLIYKLRTTKKQVG